MNLEGVCHHLVPQGRTNSSQNYKAGKEGRGPGDGAKEKGMGEAATYQSAGHRGLVVFRQMLLQGQDDAVGNDGGQDHVLKRRGKGGVKEQIHQRERDAAS